MAKKIRVLLYKSKIGDGKWIDNLISIWTRSKYSHIEIWTPNDVALFRSPCSCYDKPDDCTECSVMGYAGTCWTSTMRGKDNGTVKRDASGVLKNPARWDYVEVEIDAPGGWPMMMAYMNCEVNCNEGYAKRDLWKFVFGKLHRPDDTRNICSEFVDKALFRAFVFYSCGIVSPKKVYKKLIAKGYKVKELV
jgi:hypothetical protein